MAKSCGICGKRLGFLEGKIYVADGTICNACWTAAGQDLSWKSLYAGAQRTVNQVRDMIEIGVLKEEASRHRPDGLYRFPIPGAAESGRYLQV